MTDNIKYWTGLSSIEEINSSFILTLYSHFNNDIEKVYNSDLSAIKDIVNIRTKTLETFIRKRNELDLDKIYDNVLNKNIQILTYESSDYPEMLKNIPDAPAVLYVKGDLNTCNLQKTVAFVGSRRASTTGKLSLQKIIKELANTDICIVSGLAAGIDTTSHKSAIENNLKTIGVIASGFDFVYPESNKQLYKEIENGYGAIITEYYPNIQPLQFHFPARNRIITGLSYGTVVAEAALKSGAIISANLTLEQNRELMCIPGAITNKNTEGIYKLLKNGATLVTSGQDILEALNWEIKEPIQQKLNFDDCTEDELLILKSIDIEPKNFDKIQLETKISTEILLTNLTTLELKGIIKQVDSDKYTRS